MAHRNRIPPALEPYLALPLELSLILLTSTIGCSASWLTARFVGSALGQYATETEACNVVLVSWMRDATFWRDEVRRASGIDLSRLTGLAKFDFVDCFSDALTPAAKPSTTMARAEKKLLTAVSGLASTGQTLLVLDLPDIMLATGASTAIELNQLLLKLRSQAHAMILSCSSPLPAHASEMVPTPIEAEHAAFVVHQAHLARCVMSVRELQTGAARDVSGVLRVTRGGAIYDADEVYGEIKEMEALYLVQRDGTVNILER